MTLPILYLKKHEERRLLAGHLWVFSNEVDTTRSPLASFEPGGQALIMAAGDKPLGMGYVNPGSLIAARLCDKNPNARLDRDWCALRLSQALTLREKFFATPHYRLAFGESDCLPGLVVDRYNDVLVVQLLSAGMERLRGVICDALDELLNPTAILLKNDAHSRQLEGLPLTVETVKGSVPDEVEVPEGPGLYRTSLVSGQKTGWFFDQRPNRLALLPLCANARVLDVFCYVGALGVGAALSGAKEVACVDSSRQALESVTANARANNTADTVTTIKGDADAVLEDLAREGRRFDVISLDPPAFVKRKKDLEHALGAYHKVNKLASRLLAPGGLVQTASCSQHLEAWRFERLTARALSSGRAVQLLRRGGQGPDHPIHPAMPETDYLKSLLFRVNASQYR